MSGEGIGVITRFARAAAARLQKNDVRPYVAGSKVFGAARGRDVAADQPDPVAYLARHPLVQPDQTTCGSAALLVAEMIGSADAARRILREASTSGDTQSAQNRFATAALRIHSATNALVSPADTVQLPWPRSLGTQPWATARFLGTLPFGTRWIVLFVDPAAPGAIFDRVCAAVGDGFPCPLYVGNAASPRHVVLAVARSGPDLTVYEPSDGVLVTLTRTDFIGNRTGVLGWDQPWLAVTPD